MLTYSACIDSKKMTKISTLQTLAPILAFMACPTVAAA
jgi:hypothetical protein